MQIKFPRVTESKSDTVTVKGPSAKANACAEHLRQLRDTLAEENFALEVEVFSKYHRFIVGRQGATIKKIREDTNTKVN